MTKIESLEKEIDALATAYYNGDEKVSDKVYDAKIEELRVLDPNNPRIPGMAGDEQNPAGYKKMNHTLVTGTLKKAMTTEVAEDWVAKHQKAGCKVFHVSAKQDGIGSELQYKNGKLVHLISRGDGFTGFDKIDLAQYIPSIPNNFNSSFNASVRGELEVKNGLFKDKYFADKKNPRNAVAGLFNRKADELTAEDKRILGQVYFVAYDAIIPGDKCNTKEMLFHELQDMDFYVPASVRATSMEDIYKFRDEMAEARTQDNAFALDGVVIFENEIDHEDQKEKVQDRAIALKFDLTIAETTLTGIEWSLSGTRLTPIALCSPTSIDGTVVRRANLVNLATIEKLGIKIGDKILIAKMGMIIPKVLAKA